MTTHVRRSLIASLLLTAGVLSLTSPLFSQTPAKMVPVAATRPDARPAASQADDPNLPRVLIIGDSISMGYTDPVRRLLNGKANVHRPPDNCQHTAYGLAHLKQWLGTGKWDVIHFNFGIWDTHYLLKTTGGLVLKEDDLDPATVRLSHTPEQYRENLANIVKTLQVTGARLVWASTTPIMSRTGDRFEDIRRLNDVAAVLMKENGIPVNDLYSLVLPDIAKWQSADKCHFTAQGGNLLAEKGAQGILDALTAQVADTTPAASWKVGTPIVTYWAGPPMTDVPATQMADGGWNLVWCANEKELDVAHRHGLRGLLTDGRLAPASLDDPKRREPLDALIARVSKHPALYAYYLIDEPNASQFPALGKLVAYLRERDPAHLAYINLFPTYASNEQLGTKGDVVTAYKEHLRLFIEQVKPALISYDHYQFAIKGDNDQYFLNLALISHAAQDAGVPFLNIVQSCTWAPQTMRVPNTNELRYLVFTTLAYGAQGISYYVYACVGHHGSIASLDGTPGPLYHALKSYNREFVAIAKELQPLRSLAVYHTAMRERGCEPLPADAPFRLDHSKSPAKPRGYLLGTFGTKDKPSHVMVVNLDYTAVVGTTLVGPGELETFDATTGQWTATKKVEAELSLPPGGGQLVRVRR